MSERETTLATWCGSLQIEQRYTNGTGFCKMNVRRVMREGKREEIQIEGETATISHNSGKSRCTTKHFSFILAPAVADFLVTAITKLQPPYDAKNDRHKTSSEQDEEDRAFYGLPARLPTGVRRGA